MRPLRSSSRIRSINGAAVAGLVGLLATSLLSVTAPRAVADHTGTPTSVTIAASLQSELGCSGDWQPECAQTFLMYDAEDDIWHASFTIPAGAYEYKAALNGTWTENYGAGAQQDGPNIALTLLAEEQVHFFYSHRTHWVADSHNNTVATVAGSFQSEIGCPGDWDPSCLRSWMQDIDADGTYTFTTTEIPAGTYAFKVALDQGWNVSFPANDVQFVVPADGDAVTFSYVTSTNAVDVEIEHQGSGLEPGDERLAQDSLRTGLQGEKFYFVMPDRFANGDPSNDTAGVPAGDGRLAHGFDPTDKGFYHGGDLAGLTQQLDYLDGLGVTAVWMTPMFKNRWVQGAGGDVSAGYHGYWIVDFTAIDPHFGTNDEMRTFIAEAHERGMRVFFDIITNHTADVIKYAEGQYSYRSKAAFPYIDANGHEFDDRDYAGTSTFPPLDLDSFPYTPIFENTADATAKVPAWLNDRTLYHNRGDSTFAGESSLYGDFVGLDDLFTEHPAVLAGMTDIFQSWITELDIDGYRIDTVKHVNDEFWQAFAPAIQEYAVAHGKPDFFAFGEVFDSNASFTSQFTTRNRLQAVLDFPFQSVARQFAAGAPTDGLRDFYATDDLYTDADSNAYALPTFLGNHDMGRIGLFIGQDRSGASDAEILARDQLVHALAYLSRGNPVVYYGDEQGFVGDGGDKDARQDMFPSQVASYNDDDNIGTDATPAQDNFDPTHPIYQRIAALADLTEEHSALRTGAQIHRLSTGTAGVYAFSRVEAGQNVEYLVALNNATSDQTVAVPTFSAGMGFTRIWPTGEATAITGSDKRLTITVPALTAAVWKADGAITAPASAPSIGVAPPPAGSEVKGKVEIGANVGGSGFNQVTFAVKPEGASEWTVIGTDDAAPYRVYYDVSTLPVGSALGLKAIVKDSAGNLNADRIEVVVGEEPPTPPPGAAAPRDYLVVHYNRPDGNYAGWGLHAWGDIEGTVDWANPLPFAGEDEYGRFAWVKLKEGATSVGFIVHQGDTKDPDGDRFANPNVTPEIWLASGDSEVYDDLADARGFARIHYHRPDGDYGDPTSSDFNDFWGLHLWGDAIDPSEGTAWQQPKKPTGIDSFGAFWDIRLANADAPLNFIVHRGDTKDPGPDQSFVPSSDGEVWRVSGEETIYPTRADAQDFAVIHYHRPDGDYGDPTSSDFNDFWGMHVWTGAAQPNPSWQEPVRPARFDGFGAVFEVPLLDDAPQLNYIIHRGDTKDLSADQALELDVVGHEVWFLSGAKDANGQAKYLLPVLGGGGADVDLTKARAHWVSNEWVAWNVDGSTSHSYSLRYSADGGIEADATGVRGGQTIRLRFEPAGLPDALKVKWPHLSTYAAFRVDPRDLDVMEVALRGQLVAVDRDGTGSLRAATAVQIPGVLDDLYGPSAKSAALGTVIGQSSVSMSLWAPTAHSVRLHLFDGSSDTTPTVLEMARDAESGVWSVSGPPSWVGKQYLYEVTVWAPTTLAIETNLVTDPYSLGLTTNSARSIVVNLSEKELTPGGWSNLRKPDLARPEQQSIYELHVRDFSITDESVPAEDRGTYRAFTHEDSDGMSHLRSAAEAGLTTVHLLPVFDIATIEEVREQQQTPPCDLGSFPPDSPEQQACIQQVSDTDGFNWGYDPWHYTTPEGSYATDPSGTQRTREFREMVAALNRSGLRVVMDVVYNHTTASGQAAKSVLDRVVPGYYHRLDENGVVATSTCCANTATEHVMMGKLVVDSVVTWARDYKIDGFRFDLMGHHPLQNMLDVRAALDSLTLAEDGVDGKTIYVYGEGWNFGEVANNARFVQASQLNLAGSGIGSFNDRLRDAVRGGGPFDGNPRIQGFGSGLWSDFNGDNINGTTQQQLDRLLLAMDQIKVGLTGNLRDYEFVGRNGDVIKGSDVDCNGSPAGYTTDPQEAITYVDAHDNETLYDALAYKLPQATTMSDRVRMNVLSMSTVALGQGVAFFHAGSDLLRSKSLDRNSYNSGDWFNTIDWSYVSNNFGVGLPPAGDNADKWPFARPLLADPNLRAGFDAITASKARVQEFLRIRESSRLFTLGNTELVMQKVDFPVSSGQTPGVIVMHLDDRFGPDVDAKDEGIVVVFNATDEQQTLSLPNVPASLKLKLHPIQADGVDPVVKQASVDAASGAITVPARTTAVFVYR